MRIAFVTNHDWFFMSHRLPLAKHALVQGHEVYLLAIDTGKRGELEQMGIHFVPIPLNPTGTNPLEDIRSVLALSRLYKQLKPDVIHHITIKTTLLGCFAAKLSGQHHVVNAISGLGYAFTDGRNGLLQKVARIAMKMAFHSKFFSFILQNPEDFTSVKSMGYVPADNVYLIKGSGVDLNEFVFTPLPNNPVLEVLFPARILKDKGIMELIEAAGILREKVLGKAKFVLAGDCTSTNPTAMTEDELKPLLEEGYIEWVGFQKQMKPVYQRSDIVVLPSYREGLPKSLIEACAIGRPIVTCDVPGCRECVVDGVNGYLVTVKDPISLAEGILKLIESPELRAAFGEKGRGLAERDFSIKRVIQQHFDIYERVAMMA